MKITKSIFKLMVIVVIMIISILSVSPLSAQSNLKDNDFEKKATSAFIGFGTGINDGGMLFAGVELPVFKAVSIFANAGLGGWGWKIGGGLIYYPQHIPYKSGFSIAYYTASGLNDYTMKLWVEPSGVEESVNIDLKRCGSVNLVYSYNLKVGRSSKFVFSGGYSIPVTNDPYEVKDKSIVITASSKQLLNYMQPGGLVVGVKCMIGL
jgi:hypothetical protein